MNLSKFFLNVPQMKLEVQKRCNSTLAPLKLPQITFQKKINLDEVDLVLFTR